MTTNTGVGLCPSGFRKIKVKQQKLNININNMVNENNIHYYSNSALAQVKNLTVSVRQLECFASRSALWTEHMGQWRACVQSADNWTPENPSSQDPVVDDPVFVLLVQKEHVMLSPDSGSGKFDFARQVSSSSSSTISGANSSSGGDEVTGDGWVVARKLSEFHELRSKLVPVAGDELRSRQLPPMPTPPSSQRGSSSSLSKSWSKAELHDAKVI